MLGNHLKDITRLDQFPHLQNEENNTHLRDWFKIKEVPGKDKAFSKCYFYFLRTQRKCPPSMTTKIRLGGVIFGEFM